MVQSLIFAYVLFWGPNMSSNSATFLSRSRGSGSGFRGAPRGKPNQFSLHPTLESHSVYCTTLHLHTYLSIYIYI